LPGVAFDLRLLLEIIPLGAFLFPVKIRFRFCLVAVKAVIGIG